MPNVIEKLKELREQIVSGTWGYYDNGFDGYVVANLRKASPGERTTFDCGLKFDEMIFGGSPCEGRAEDDANTQLIVLMRNSLDDLITIAEQAEALLDQGHRSVMNGVCFNTEHFSDKAKKIRDSLDRLRRKRD